MNDKPTVKLKTITFYVKNDKQIKIFDVMTKYSRNIYNTFNFCFNVFSLYKNHLFKNIYLFIKQNNYQNIKLIKKENYDQIMINKLDKIHSKLYELFNKDYDFYINNLPLFRTNNNLIYNYIKNLLKNIVLNNKNFNVYKTQITNHLSGLIKFDLINKNFVFSDIVNNILRSFYNKNYFKLKNEIIQKKPFSVNDLELIKNVKENDYLFETKQINYKKLIKSELFLELLSDQNIITRIAYKLIKDKKNPNYNKLPSDIVTNIFDKAYQNINSFFKLKEKGIKCNMPKYLPLISINSLFFLILFSIKFL